jgi:tetratricopeptide (TPR) repeat protein
MAELLSYFQRLPAREAGEDVAHWSARLGDSLRTFAKEARSRYLEGTLQRLLHSASPETRQGAVLALGQFGTMASNRALAKALRDADEAVRYLAGEALWAVWSRADTPENNRALRRLRRRADRPAVDCEALLAGFDALLQSAPAFAEAYNQRAIFYFRTGEWQGAIADCEKALKLNPYHFGAASGMAQCYLKQRKVRPALRAYRRAYHINPNLTGLPQVIRSLERMLGEEGKR